MNSIDKKIADYVDGLLEKKEIAAFEEILKSNLDLQAKVEERRTYIQDIKAAMQRDEMMRKFKSFQSTINTHSGKMTSGKKLWLMSMAASVAIILSVVTLIKFIQPPENNQNIGYEKMVKETKEGSSSLTPRSNEPNHIETGEATAFLIRNDGYFLTNYHVIINAEKIEIQVDNDSLIRYSAGVVAYNSILDVTILKIDSSYGFSSEPLPYAMGGDIILGEEVFTLGYPKFGIVYGNGTVSSVTGFHDDTLACQVSIPINKGNSGSPLFNKNGDIVGVITAKNISEDGAAYGVKVAYLKEFIDTMGVKINEVFKFPTKSKVRNIKRTSQINKLQQFVYKIIVTKNPR